MQHTTLILDGRRLAADILARCRPRAEAVRRRTGRPPCFAVVLIGGDENARRYAARKAARANEAGVELRLIDLPPDTTAEHARAEVAALNADAGVHGILVQLPVPPHLDARALIECIGPRKDLDAATADSFGALSLGQPGFVPCTPDGAMRLVEAHGLAVAGKRAVVIDRGDAFGKPMAMVLLNADATVTVCGPDDPDVRELALGAEVLVVSAARPGLVRSDWVRAGAIVIDAGYFQGPVGDVDTASVLGKAAALAPVPGGVGPMTIALLIEQTVRAAETGALHRGDAGSR